MTDSLWAVTGATSSFCSNSTSLGSVRLIYVFCLRTSTLIVFVALPGTLVCLSSLTLRRFNTTRLGEFSPSDVAFPWRWRKCAKSCDFSSSLISSSALEAFIPASFN